METWYARLDIYNEGYKHEFWPVTTHEAGCNSRSTQFKDIHQQIIS